MKALLCITITLILVTLCYGDEAETNTAMPDAGAVTANTSGKWNWVVDNFPDLALVFFTAVLTGATIYYAIQTGKSVQVSREVLKSNEELIELNKAQNNLTKAELLSKIYELSSQMSTEVVSYVVPGIVGEDLKKSIRVYLERSATVILSDRDDQPEPDRKI